MKFETGTTELSLALRGLARLVVEIGGPNLNEQLKGCSSPNEVGEVLGKKIGWLVLSSQSIIVSTDFMMMEVRWGWEYVGVAKGDMPMETMNVVFSGWEDEDGNIRKEV